MKIQKGQKLLSLDILRKFFYHAHQKQRCQILIVILCINQSLVVLFGCLIGQLQISSGRMNLPQIFLCQIVLLLQV